MKGYTLAGMLGAAAVRLEAWLRGGHMQRPGGRVAHRAAAAAAAATCCLYAAAQCPPLRPLWQAWQAEGSACSSTQAWPSACCPGGGGGVAAAGPLPLLHGWRRCWGLQHRRRRHPHDL